jgi:hypothetical protein
LSCQKYFQYCFFNTIISVRLLPLAIQPIIPYHIEKMDSLKVVIGFLLLLAGSQLYWLTVAIAGIIIGDYVELHSIRFLDQIASIGNSIKYSLLGIVFSITAKPFAVLATGFIMGGFLTFNLPDVFGWRTDWFNWQYFVFAGVVIAILLWFFYALTMIFVTSLTGAVIIVQSSNLQMFNNEAVLLLFLILGVAIQTLLMNYSEPTVD